MQDLENIRLIVPLVTPYEHNGDEQKINIKGLKKLVYRVISGGADALFVLGTTGEFYNLSDTARNRTIDIVVSETTRQNEKLGKNIVVLAGAIGETAGKTKKYIIDAEERGADVAVIAPRYNKEERLSRDKDTLDFIDYTLKDSKIPIVLYNNPNLPNSGNIGIDNIQQLSENKRIIGLKESSGYKDYLWAMMNNCPKDFKIYQGDESQISLALDKGAYGAVPSIANVDPRVCMDLIKTKDEKYQNQILELQEQVYGKNFSREDVPAGIKKRLNL